MKSNVIAVVVLVAVVGSPPVAAAQSPTSQQVEAVVKPGERLRVTLADGKVRRGRFQLVDSDGLEVKPFGSGRTRLDLSQIRRIEVDIPDPVSDSAKRGGLIGLAIGGGFGVLIAAALCEGLDECAAGAAIGLTLGGIGAGLGAGFGALGDSLITDTRVVWPAPLGASVSRPVGLGVFTGPRRLGVRLTIRW